MFSLYDIDNIRWPTVKTLSHSFAIIELEWLRYVYTSYQLRIKIFLFQRNKVDFVWQAGFAGDTMRGSAGGFIVLVQRVG